MDADWATDAFYGATVSGASARAACAVDMKGRAIRSRAVRHGIADCPQGLHYGTQGRASQPPPFARCGTGGARKAAAGLSAALLRSQPGLLRRRVRGILRLTT